VGEEPCPLVLPHEFLKSALVNIVNLFLSHLDLQVSKTFSPGARVRL